MGLRTRNEKVPDGERHFMTAAMKKAMREGFLPVTVRNFLNKKDQEGG